MADHSAIPALAALLSRYPTSLQHQLHEHLLQGSLPAAVVQECLNFTGQSIESLMVELVPVATAWARAPISRYSVGAVALGLPSSSRTPGVGGLYLGANMEFIGASLQFSIHAEQSAANHAWLRGETGLQAMATSAAPCGHCRQFLREIATIGDGLRLLRPARKNERGIAADIRSLQDMLPDSFGPDDLQQTMKLMSHSSRPLQADVQSPAEQAALQAAEQSYAPYTGNYAGVALVTEDQQIITGRSAENAAFNPSLTAIASALAHSHMGQPPGVSIGLREVILVERPHRSMQSGATAFLLQCQGLNNVLHTVEATSRGESA